MHLREWLGEWQSLRDFADPLMPVFYSTIAEANEVPEGACKAIDFNGREIVVTRSDGELFAFARYCPHEEADLLTGEISGSEVRCEGHSYCYDLRTGACLNPAGGPTLAVLPVEEHEGQLRIKLEW